MKKICFAISKLLKHIRVFFYANPRDLGMQNLSVQEIAELMKPVDSSALPLPHEFARMVHKITHKS